MGVISLFYLKMGKIRTAFKNYFVQLNNCGNIASIPYEWNPQTFSYQRREKSPRISFYTRLVVALNTLIVITTIYVVLSAETLTNKIVSLCVSGINVMMTRIRIIHSTESHTRNVVAFLNSLKTLTKGKDSYIIIQSIQNVCNWVNCFEGVPASRSNIVVMRTNNGIAYFLTLFTFFLLIVEASRPPLFTYALLTLFPDLKSYTTIITAISNVVAVLTAIATFQALSSGVVFIVYEILKYLLAIKKHLETINCSVIKNQSRGKLILFKYRKLQILSRIFNTIFHIFNEIIGLVALTSISLAFCIIKLHEEVPMVGIVTGSMYFVTGVVMSCILWLCGSIQQKSMRVLNCLTNTARALRINNKSDLKTIRSCVPLNVKLGSATNICRKTPVYFLHFIFEQTVNLVLLNT